MKSETIQKRVVKHTFIATVRPDKKAEDVIDSLGNTPIKYPADDYHEVERLMKRLPNGTKITVTIEEEA